MFNAFYLLSDAIFGWSSLVEHVMGLTQMMSHTFIIVTEGLGKLWSSVFLSCMFWQGMTVYTDFNKTLSLYNAQTHTVIYNKTYIMLTPNDDYDTMWTNNLQMIFHLRCNWRQLQICEIKDDFSYFSTLWTTLSNVLPRYSMSKLRPL